MQQGLKIAVIGMGQMGMHHARVFKKMPLVELAAICESDNDRREKAREEFNCRAYANYNELLVDPAIDAVSIVLPDNMHRDCVEMAVKNKKHIFLEKPLANNLDDGQAMYDALKDYEKVFTVGFILRFDPRFAMIKESLDDGTLGDIIHAYCRRNSPITGPRRYIGA